jgi:membrane-associated phospholipid phosphatase
MHWVQGFTLRYPDELWRCFNTFGHFLGASFLFFILTRKAIAVFSLGLATVLGSLAIRLLKVSIDEVRPAALMPDDLHIIGETLNHHAMPSGHSLTIAIVFGLLLSLDSLRRNQRRFIAVLLPALVIGVGLARVASGAHWPADVLVGIGLGLPIGYLSGRVTQEQSHRLPHWEWLHPVCSLLIALALVLTPLPPSHSMQASVMLGLCLALWQCLQGLDRLRSFPPKRL